MSASACSSTANSDPWALRNLLPVGTISTSVLSKEPQIVRDRQYAEDHWETFPVTDAVLDELATDEETAKFFRELQFLQLEKYIRITCRTLGRRKELRLRIYIVPFDLKGDQGYFFQKKDIIRFKAKKLMHKLLSRIVTNKEKWEGGQGGVDALLLPPSKDPRTLTEHYADLSSPSPVPMSHLSGRLLDCEDDLSGLGIRTKLYQYQRRTVAAMVQRESDLRDVPDPLFISLKTIHGEEFYLQPETTEVRHQQLLTPPCRGGILCEELGTGKTLMVLALILSTLKQLSSPAESVFKQCSVLTPISLGYFPTRECIDARSHLLLPNPYPTVPSLTEMLIHRARTEQLCTTPDLRSPSGIRKYEKQKQLAHKVDDLPVVCDIIKHNVPFYYHHPCDSAHIVHVYRSSRSKDAETVTNPIKIYLSHATLVIVPTNLFSHWAREIGEHCGNGGVKLFKLTTGTDTPSARSLAGQYDIVLVTYERFITESNISPSESSGPTSPQSCKCPPFPKVHIRGCTCEEQTFRSPLLHVRWKRLVIDEGHASGTTLTKLAHFSNQLCVERKWIVTGTPTTGLLGLSFGEGKIDDEDNELGYHGSSPSPLSSSQASLSAYTWSQQDRSDLLKLGHILSNSVGIPQFKANPKLFTTHVIEPLMNPSGPRPGAIEILRRIMESVMIRHRIHEIEDEVDLPPLKLEVVLMDMDPLAVKSYNALQATIAINAVDSQRCGQDYMLHPKNTEYLQLALKNISQVMFWSANRGVYFCDELMEVAQQYVDRALDRNISPEDMELLNIALKHIRLAAQDPLWRSINMHEDVPCYVYGMDMGLSMAWSHLPSTSRYQDFSGIFNLDRLCRMKRIISIQPLIEKKAFVEAGKDNSIRDQRKVKTNDFKSTCADVWANSAKKCLKLSTRTARDVNMTEDGKTVSEESMSFTLDETYQCEASLFIARSCVKNSASTKLNYIVNEVMQYASTEKILIFSGSEISLLHISNALDLVDVKHCLFTSHTPLEKRQQAVLAFETSDACRVLLMELKHGARGLNLVAASRVIFCEPVWRADVEKQALKRVYRVGQTRPVIVKTLAIRGTIEEEMISRRKALQNGSAKLPSLFDEGGMRQFIANPKFIEDPPKDLPQLSFRLFNIPILEPCIADTGDLYPKPTDGITGTSFAMHFARARKRRSEGEPEIHDIPIPTPPTQTQLPPNSKRSKARASKARTSKRRKTTHSHAEVTTSETRSASSERLVIRIPAKRQRLGLQ